MAHDDNIVPPSAWPEFVEKVRARTPARIFVERGASYTTRMQLDLRGARASAVDAVWTESDLTKDFAPDFVAQWKLFQVSSQAESKSQFLLRPDLGRKLSDAGKNLVVERCSRKPEFQIVIGDGLSGAAVAEQVPSLFPLLHERAHANGWSIGQPFFVRYCRVGIINDIGELLSPRVIVLLIGERPGLATATSLSAYMAFQPTAGHSDANRNLISNIHARGVQIEDAADRIIHLASRMMTLKRSGTALKEESAQLPG
jgi:ethanolamine ammonia-lyase small subunit